MIGSSNPFVFLPSSSEHWQRQGGLDKLVVAAAATALHCAMWAVAPILGRYRPTTSLEFVQS